MAALNKHCYCFSNPEIVQGPVASFLVDDHPVTANGFNKNHNPADLVVKPCPKGGLGIAATPENGINNSYFVQFDLTSLLADHTVKGIELCLTELDCRGDRIELYGSNEMGMLGNKIYKSNKDEKCDCVQVPHYGKYKYVSITLHSHSCEDKLGVLVKSFCIYSEYVHAYAFVYSDSIETVPMGGNIEWDHVPQISGFNLVDNKTLICQVKGIYSELMTVDTLEPNACAVYVNGVKVLGSWFGANATAQDVGNTILKLNIGDQIELRNESSQGGTITLSPLGSGPNSTYGQTTACFSIHRIA